ncbi:hypothetical protein V6N13_116606 [Hibiscus sabdariffa]
MAQRGVVEDARRKKDSGRPSKGAKAVSGDCVNHSLTDSDIKNRQQVLLKEAEATVQLGGLLGVSTLGSEEEFVTPSTRPRCQPVRESHTWNS